MPALFLLHLHLFHIVAEALEIEVAFAFEVAVEVHILTAVRYVSLRHLIVQVHPALHLAYGLVHNDEIFPVHEEYRAPVGEVLVARMFGHKHLHITFRLPEYGLGIHLVHILVVHNEGIVVGSGAEPFSPFHNLRVLALIYI